MRSNKIINRVSPSLLRALEKWMLAMDFIILCLGVIGLLNFYFAEPLFSATYALNRVTSINFILSAVALIMLKKGQSKTGFLWIAKLISIGIFLIAVWNLFSYLTANPGEPLPGFMPANSAFQFLLISISLFLLNHHKAFVSQSLSLISSLIALLSLIGHFHNMQEFHVPFQNSYEAIPATLCFFLLSITMLLAGKNEGYMAEITSLYSGGKMARRLIPMLLLTPLLLEFIRISGETSGYYSAAFGIVLFFCTILGIFFFIILSTVISANKIDRALEEEINERHKVETEIKANNLFLETILDNIPNMVFVKKGKELRFAAINKAGEQLLGLPRSEYLGKTDDDLFPKEQAEFFKQKDQEVYTNEIVVVIEEEPVDTKNGRRWLRTKKIPVKDESGAPLYLVGISEDITEKRIQDEKIKQFYAELEQKVDERTEELSNSEKRFRALIENSTDGITITNEKSVIIYESPGVERMSGFSMEEKQGSRFLDHIHPDEVEKCEKLYDELLLQPGKPIFRQFRMLHKRGEYIWVEGTITNLLDDKSVRATIFNYRDITERKQHEQERELLIQELTRHNKDLRQFSYITSHNLRAPVSNLLGLLGLLKYTPVEDPSLKEIIHGFSLSTNSLNDTINDLLKILYIKENKSMELEDIDLNVLVKKIFGQVANLIEEVEPEISVAIKPQSVIHFNRTYLESIFLNLLTNAIKYRSDKRKLNLHITFEDFDDKSIVVFQDNGIGLDLETCKTKVFGLYQRFHNHPDSKGLGLYLVKTHMETLGGNIEIESRVDVGTKFVLTFNKLYAEQSSVY
ncbi:MAG: PAS domain S-box protein [Pyrinomonadaceae bacterium]|nr:PAS domain S-box protein [Sphingobacteriaceae bacterium]